MINLLHVYYNKFNVVGQFKVEAITFSEVALYPSSIILPLNYENVIVYFVFPGLHGHIYPRQTGEEYLSSE